MKRYWVLLLCGSIMLCPQLSAQQSRQDSLTVMYRVGSGDVEPQYDDNEAAISSFIDRLQKIADDPLRRVKRISFRGLTSPDGVSTYNLELADVRGHSLADYIVSRIDTTKIKVVVEKSGIAWAELAQLVAASDMDHRDEVLNIINNVPVWVKSSGKIVSSRKAQLMQMHYGNTYRYMAKRFFPLLRRAEARIAYVEDAAADEKKDLTISGEVIGDIVATELGTGREIARGSVSGMVDGEITDIDHERGIVTVRGKVRGRSSGDITGSVTGTVIGTTSISGKDPIVVKGPIRIDDADSIRINGSWDEKRGVAVTGNVSGTLSVVDTVYIDPPKPVEAVEPEPVMDDAVIEEERQIVIKEYKPFHMAFKTNLLYDAALVPNIGIEFHLGRRWSLGGDWMYAWWKQDQKKRSWRCYGGELELRKYFGRKSAERPLSGHHFGLYFQGATYDISVGGKGNLSKLSYGAGLEYGYSLPVSRSLNIDFGIGGGYFGGKYDVYEHSGSRNEWISSNKRHWFGPTKLEISLVWIIGRGNYNVKKEGNK